MPTLKQRTYRQKREKKEFSYKKSKDWEEFYNSRAWKTLRNWWISEHPLCEVCEIEGRSVPAEQVHHLEVWSHGKTKTDKWLLFLDDTNLCSCCTYHHKQFHRYLTRLNQNYLSKENLAFFESIDKKDD